MNEKDIRETLDECKVKDDILRKFGWRSLVHFLQLAGWGGVTAFLASVFAALVSEIQDGNKARGVYAVFIGILIVYGIIAAAYHVCKLVVVLADVFTVHTTGFRIEEDTLVNSCYDEYSFIKHLSTLLKGRGKSTSLGYEHAMYFHKYGRMVCNDSDLSCFRDYGGDFYLAVYGKKNKPVKAYSKKAYKLI